MAVISFLDGGRRFNYRVAGVAVEHGRVLVHRPVWEGFWTLPGGRAEFFEHSPDTLRREIREELGVEAAVGRLLFVCEHFFTYRGVPYHELGLYFALSLPAGPHAGDGPEELPGVDPETPLVFRWAPIETARDLPLVPDFLPARLTSLPSETEHILHTSGTLA